MIDVLVRMCKRLVYMVGAGLAQSVVCSARCHAALQVQPSSEPPVEGIFPLELSWVLAPFPKNSWMRV